MSGLAGAVHLLPAGEVFGQGCESSALVAACGELVTSGPGGEEDPHYCAECVREALRWCVQPALVSDRNILGASADDR